MPVPDSRPPADDDRFRAEDARGTPLMRAVEQLEKDSGRSIESMELLSRLELGELAETTYGAELPEFWRVWLDWHRPQPLPPTGDL